VVINRSLVLLFFWFFTVSILASIVAVPWVIVRLPTDYFHSKRPPQPPFAGFPPAARVLLIGAKNLLGLVLVAVGLMFLLMPGQGVIVILIGVSLLDFPRKKQLERWLISRGPILKLANWLRTKWNKEPLKLD
jgi:hypothetical protein